MTVPTRNIIIYCLLAALWLMTASWQFIEHQRVRASARAALASRAQDTAAALSVVIRSQGRFGMGPQQRIMMALEELVNSTELTSVSLLNASNDIVASAGAPMDIDITALMTHREHWHDTYATFLNLVALGPASDTDAPAPYPQHPDIERGERRGMPPPDAPDPLLGQLLPPEQWRQMSSFMNGRVLDADDADRVLALFPDEALTGRRRESCRRLLVGRPLDQAVLADIAAILRPPPMHGRRGMGRRGPPDDFPRRPMWLGEMEYERLVEARGVHWFVVTMPAGAVHAEIARDIRLRLLAAAVVLVACAALGWAWHAFSRAADLQLRLVRAESLAAHLKELNMAAAGLMHETKNPLNIIRGLAQVISREPDTPASIRDISAKITEESDRVADRLNRFLDYSRPIHPQCTRIHIRDMIENVTGILDGDCYDKELRFEIDAPFLSVEADEDMLRQILFNLLLNAVQAAPRGSVVEVRVAPPANERTVIEIRDSGPGVPPDLREEIFRPYFTTSPNGAGLGLALVRQFAHAHHWEVECAPMDRGALFRICGVQVARPKEVM